MDIFKKAWTGVLGASRQLRWRIIAGHMVVILVGVMMLAVMSELFILSTTPESIRPYLTKLAEAVTPEAVNSATTELIAVFYRDAIFRALSVAAASAIVAGMLTSLFLVREILQPLNQIANSSRRIAEGRYSERVTIPKSTEMATVATHFNEMAEALEQIEQKRIALISNVMHELRTPLTGLEGYLEGLMDGVFASEPETFVQMSHEVRRLKRLVNDLQSLSQVESGRISLQMETFDLVPVAERIINQLMPQAVAQDMELVRIVPQNPVIVLADPDRTAQILVNMLGNAIRYTPDAGCITITVTQSKHTVQVEVSDDGIGIPADALPYIFERFFRVDRSRARSSGGSGIGLTISRHLAWAMGGELEAASDGRDQGSTFTLTLPRSV
jgi:histidine kinase